MIINIKNNNASISIGLQKYCLIFKNATIQAVYDDFISKKYHALKAKTIWQSQ